MTDHNPFETWAAELIGGDWLCLREALVTAARASNDLVTAMTVQPGLAGRIGRDPDDVERDAQRVNNWLGVMICRLDRAYEECPDYRPPVPKRG